MYLKEKQFTIIKVYLAYMYVFFFIEFMHKQKIILVFYLRYVFCTLSNIPNTALNPKATTFQLFLGAIVLIRLPLSLVLFTFNQSF